MKITLDLSKLVEEGKLTASEAERLKSLAARETGSLGINILVGFGVVAVATGVMALVPTPAMGAVVGLAIFMLGLLLAQMQAQQWALLAQICIVIGALIASGGAIALGQGSTSTLLLVTVGLAAAAVVARSSLLMAAAVLALGASIGARSGYWHATYALAIYEPLVTVVLFSAVALAAYQLSHRLAAAYERLASTAARTSIFMVNFGFWIGSLWGDRMLLLRRLSGDTAAAMVVIPSWAFAVAWAVALAGIGIWGVIANRLWVVNIAAVFAAIHFYTQWFERLGASPGSILLGGVILLGIAMALWTLNRRIVPA